MQPSLEAVMRPLDGVAHLQDLLAAGYSRYQIAALHRQGRLLRPRIGWYLAPWHDAAVVAAVRVGGRMACVSAARSYGLPVPDDPRTHVCLPPNASRLRSSTDGRRVGAGQDHDVVWHWGEAAGPRSRVDPAECLRAASACVPAPWFIGMVDAARRSGLLGARALDRIAGELAEEKRRLLARSDPSAESILESLFRVGLMDAGLVAESQVPIGAFRVDFLIDGWLVVECDGGEHHSGRSEFEQDRRRDAALAQAGSRVLRFSYRQIVHHWADVLATVLAVLGAGRPAAPHRRSGSQDGVSS